MPKQEHQLGNQGFYGTVVTADNPCVEQVESRFIESHFHHTGQALRDVHNDDSPFGCFLQELDEPRLLWSVSGTIGFKHHGTESRCVQNVPDNVFLNTREKCQHNHIRVVQEVGFQWFGIIRFMYLVVFIFNMDACSCQKRIIVGTESIEVLRIDFGGTVAAQQVVFEDDTHFGYDSRSIRMLGCSNLDGSNQVFLTVGT